MKPKTRAAKIGITFLAVFTLLCVFFLQGAVVSICALEGVRSTLIQGAIIGGGAILMMLVCLVREHGLGGLGFRRPLPGSVKKLWYFAPLIVVALLAFVAGVEVNQGEVLLANVFFALAVGFAEEICFRGIVCRTWSEGSTKSAVIISSVMFCLCHMMNVLGGAEIVETLFQICFAFVYGLIFALIFIRTQSIWPCILLHALHDFCAFICRSGLWLDIVVGALQFLILLGYLIALCRVKQESNPESA